MNVTDISILNNTSPAIGLRASHVVTIWNQTEIDLRCSKFWYQAGVPTDIALAKFIAYRVLLRIIMFFGITGNLINLVVLRSFKGRTYFYLLWLAVSDLCVMLSYNIRVQLFNSTPTFYVLAFFLCHILSRFMMIFLATSTFIVVVLTVERFQAVWNPIQRRGGSADGRPWYIVLLCLTLATVIVAPSSFMLQIETVLSHDRVDVGNVTIACHVCTFSPFKRSDEGKAYVIVRDVLIRVIPIIVVVSLNIAIITLLTRHQRVRSSLNCSTEPPKVDTQNGEEKLKACLITITVFFIVCMSPIVIRNVFRTVFPAKTLTSEIFGAMSVLLVHTNTACNFYVYCFCSQAIRQRLLELCRKALPRWKAAPDVVTDKATNDSRASATSTVSMSSLRSGRSYSISAT